MEETKRRELNYMPYDKVFDVDSNEELCHATGDEVCFGDPENPSDWWVEFSYRNGDLHYGR